MADSAPIDSSESFADSDLEFSPSDGELSGSSEIAADPMPAPLVTPADSDVDSNSDGDEIHKPEKTAGKLLADFNIFNAMLTASLLFILLATFFLFWELAGYGGLDGSWRTGSVGR